MEMLLPLLVRTGEFHLNFWKVANYFVCVYEFELETKLCDFITNKINMCANYNRDAHFSKFGKKPCKYCAFVEIKEVRLNIFNYMNLQLS